MAPTPAEHLQTMLGWDRESDDDGFFHHLKAVSRFCEDVGDDSARPLALSWSLDDDARVRAVGLDVLGALAEDDADTLVSLLVHAERAVDHPDAGVRWAAVQALGRGDDPRIASLVLRYLQDGDARVRWQAVTALPTLVDVVDPPIDHPVVRGLLLALDDADADVRDWAAFGLGVQLGVDTAEVRAALARRRRDTTETDPTSATDPTPAPD